MKRRAGHVTRFGFFKRGFKKRKLRTQVFLFWWRKSVLLLQSFPCYRGMGQAWTAKDVLTFRQHVNGVLGIKNTGFRKNRLTVFLWRDEKGGFWIRRYHSKSPSPDHTSYSAFHACKECYHDSNTLRVEAAWCGSVFFFSRTEQKISVFKIIQIRVADSFVLSEVYI